MTPKIEIMYIINNLDDFNDIICFLTLVHHAGKLCLPQGPADPEWIATKVCPSISPSLLAFPSMYNGPPSSPLQGPYIFIKL